MYLREGPKWERIGTAIWQIFYLEGGIWITWTGTGNEKIGKTIGWEMGFGQNLG